LTSVPILVVIDRIEVVLCEKDRTPLPNILGKLFKKSNETDDYGVKDKLGLDLPLSHTHTFSLGRAEPGEIVEGS